MLHFSQNYPYFTERMDAFDKTLITTEDSSFDWLVQAMEKHGHGGCPHSRWIYLPSAIAWKKDYPETTGYLIENLMMHNQVCRDLAFRAGEWLLKIQSPEGFFYSGTKFKIPSTFNTAQILFGLRILHQYTKDSRFEHAIQKAFKWLIEGIDTKGNWLRGLYVDGYFATYYSRALWPVALVDQEFGQHKKHELLGSSLECLFANRNEHDFFRHLGFSPNKPAISHTVIYALEGFHECSLLYDDYRIESYVRESLIKMCNTLKHRSVLPGICNEDGSFSDSFVCVTGQAQFCSLLLKVYQRNPESIYIETATRFLAQLFRWQIQHGSPEHQGAFPSSIPVWQAYFPFRYTNWTVKFFLDACHQMKQVRPV